MLEVQSSLIFTIGNVLLSCHAGNSIHCNQNNILVASLRIYTVGIYYSTTQNFKVNLKFIPITLYSMNTTRHYVNMWREIEPPLCQHRDTDTVICIMHDS